MMIERHDKLSHARQCHILGLARSTYYYQPQPASDVELVLAAKDGRAIPKNTTIWFAQLRHMVFSSGKMDADFCIQALQAAIQDHGCPQIFNTDQGAQFTSEAWIAVLKNHDIQISMDGKGCYHDNIFVERLWRTVKYELLYTRAFSDLKEVRKSLIQWFNWYNQERFHQGLDNQTPNEVYCQYQAIHQAAWA